MPRTKNVSAPGGGDDEDPRRPRMPRTKNVSAPGGGDDEDPRRPFRHVKGKTVYLERQEGRKKRHLDRAARAAAVAAAAAAE